jgi:uncharacterized membrane protein (DUF373 family)
MQRPEAEKRPPSHTRLANKVLVYAEDFVYIGIAVVLVLVSLALLVVSVGKLAHLVKGDAQNAAVDVLDTLLLLFIIVELLFAVRATLLNRELVAEPFLLVGIIASIKEIVVLSVKAAGEIGTGAKFRDSLWEIGVLGVLVLLLGVTSFLLRRKEREPEEGEGPNGGHAAKAEATARA